MGRTATNKKKKDGPVPRKRLLAEPPPLPKPAQPVGRESIALVILVAGLFIGLSLGSFVSQRMEAAREAPVSSESEAHAGFRDEPAGLAGSEDRAEPPVIIPTGRTTEEGAHTRAGKSNQGARAEISVAQPASAADPERFPPYRKNLMGSLGGLLAQLLFSALGWCSFAIVLWSMLLARSVWLGWSPTSSGSASSFVIGGLSSGALLISLAAISSVLWGYSGGGAIGAAIAFRLVDLVNEGGTLLVMGAVALIALAYATGIGAAGIVAVLKLIVMVVTQAVVDALRTITITVATALAFCARLLHRMATALVGGAVAGSSSLIRGRAARVAADEDSEEGDDEPFYLGNEDDEESEEEEADSEEEQSDDSDTDVTGDTEEDEEEEEVEPTPRKSLASRAKKKLRMKRAARAAEPESDEDDNDGEAEESEDSAPLKITRHTDSEDEESDADEEPGTRKLRTGKLLNGKLRRTARLNGSDKGQDAVKGDATAKGKQPLKGKTEGTPSRPARDGTVYQIPPTSLLSAPERIGTLGPKDAELRTSSRRLEQTLLNFRIGGRVIEVHPGPVITLYEFEPAPGVKVQKVVSLADDLALALKVASVRVYAPVPGKGTVGIEVPNEAREIVRLRDLIEYPGFTDPQQQLALALGKDTFGEPFIADLSKMPHLLIAGATGTGKSVCINSLLLSLIYRNTPDDLRLIMIDPKMLELSIYEDIPHLKAPVVTHAKRARGVLWWAVEEMERRYELMKNAGVRNLASYNSVVESAPGKGVNGTGSHKTANGDGALGRKAIIELREKDIIATKGTELTLGNDAPDPRSGSATRRAPRVVPTEKLPRIVIVVDELADLMLTVGREIEELLTRLAQKARAAGIHLILATQRPSVNVITGLIKANFPSRISFKVASRIDARTVLDTSGAEKLLGQGDMLFLSPGAGRPKRLHSPFVADSEVHLVTEWLRNQGEPEYDEQIQTMIEKLDQMEAEGGEGGDGAPAEHDDLYDQAVNLVLEKGFASTSMVQRAFRIGYNRAARILEVMEREGVVGPADGAKPRPVIGGSRSLEI